MGVTLRSIILAGCFIIIAAIAYRVSLHFLPKADDEVLLKYPTFVAEGFHGENYNAQGRLTAEIASDHVEYFRHKNLVTMEEPLGIWYDLQDDGSNNRWQITAEYGTYDIDTKAVLEGRVTAVPLHEEAQVQKITTEKLTYDLLSNTVLTDLLVEIEGRNFTNSGVGLEADLTDRIVTIKGGTHARYFPNP